MLYNVVLVHPPNTPLAPTIQNWFLLHCYLSTAFSYMEKQTEMHIVHKSHMVCKQTKAGDVGVWYLSQHVCSSIHSFHLSMYPSIWLSILSPSIHQWSLHLFDNHTSVHASSINLCVDLFIHSSMHQFDYQSLCPSNHTTHPSIHPSMHPFTLPSTILFLNLAKCYCLYLWHRHGIFTDWCACIASYYLILNHYLK